MQNLNVIFMQNKYYTQSENFNNLKHLKLLRRCNLSLRLNHTFRRKIVGNSFRARENGIRKN